MRGTINKHAGFSRSERKAVTKVQWDSGHRPTNPLREVFGFAMSRIVWQAIVVVEYVDQAIFILLVCHLPSAKATLGFESD